MSTEREKEISEDIEGQRHAGSGSYWNKRGDASNEKILVEDKFVVNKKYSVNLGIIDKLTTQAKKQNKIPILRFGYKLPNVELNCVCIETCYCNSLSNNVEIYASKKSKMLDFSLLQSIFIMADGDPVIVELIFTSVDRRFYIIEWKEFIEHQSRILVLEK